MKYDILTAAIVRQTRSYKHFYGQYAVKVENLPNNRQQGYGSGCFGRIRIRIFLGSDSDHLGISRLKIYYNKLYGRIVFRIFLEGRIWINSTRILILSQMFASQKYLYIMYFTQSVSQVTHAQKISYNNTYLPRFDGHLQFQGFEEKINYDDFFLSIFLYYKKINIQWGGGGGKTFPRPFSMSLLNVQSINQYY